MSSCLRVCPPLDLLPSLNVRQDTLRVDEARTEAGVLGLLSVEHRVQGIAFVAAGRLDAETVGALEQGADVLRHRMTAVGTPAVEGEDLGHLRHLLAMYALCTMRQRDELLLREALNLRGKVLDGIVLRVVHAEDATGDRESANENGCA